MNTAFKSDTKDTIERIHNNLQSGFDLDEACKRERCTVDTYYTAIKYLNKNGCNYEAYKPGIYRCITFQPAIVVDILLNEKVWREDKFQALQWDTADIEACNGKTPIQVFLHPALYFDSIGNKQLFTMLKTFELSLPRKSLKDLYMIELLLPEIPTLSKTSDSGIISELRLEYVASIHKLVERVEPFYDLDQFKVFKKNALFGSRGFNKNNYEADKLPVLSLDDFSKVEDYYDYVKVRDAYVKALLKGSNCENLRDMVYDALPSNCVSLYELYSETTRIINQSRKKLTVNNITAIQKRTTITPDENPFDYNPETHMLTILEKTDAKIRINAKGVVDFMHSIKPLLNTRYKCYEGEPIANTPDALRDRLSKENYIKLPGPINCEVWGVFNDAIENLLMLEIIYPYTGSRHINVALDLSKF